LTRRSAGSSGRECRSLRVQHAEELASFVAAVAGRLRAAGLQVSLAEEVEAARLLSIYAALSGSGELGAGEAASVVASVFARRVGEEALVAAAVRRVLCGAPEAEVMEHVEEGLRRLGLSFGEQVQWRRRLRPEAMQDYISLRLLGFISRGRRGEYVVSRRQAARLAREVAERYGGFEQAVKARAEAEIRRGGRLLGEAGAALLQLLGRSPRLDEAVRVYAAARRAGDRRQAARAIAEALDRGERPASGGEAAKAFEALSRGRLLTLSRARVLLEAEPRLAPRVARELGREALIDMAVSMAGEGRVSEAAEALVRGLGLPAADMPGVEEALRRGRLGELLEGSERLRAEGRLRSYLLRYFETGNRGYLDMAAAEAERARLSGPLAEALAEGDEARLLREAVRGLEPYEAFRILHSVYTGTANAEVKLLAARLLHILWRRLVRGFGEAARRMVKVEGRAVALDVRDTVYRVIRLHPQPLVGLARGTRRRLVLLLDKSGSMAPYSFYALAAAAALAPLVSRLVLFDEKPSSLPTAMLRRSPLRAVETLLATRFAGYTDVSGALDYATRSHPPSKLILISDLRQTVATSKPVETALAEATARGWKIAVIMPGDAEPPNVVEGIPGLRLYRADTPKKLQRILLDAMLRG